MAVSATAKAAPPPPVDTPEAIESMLAEVRAARSKAEAEILNLSEKRRAMLASASPQAIREIETRARTAELVGEQCDARELALIGRLSNARAAEKSAHIEALFLEASQAAETFIDWWATDYEPLARQIAGGLRLEALARRAAGAYREAIRRAVHDPAVGAAGGLPPQGPLPELPRTNHKSPSLTVCLPAGASGGAPIAWPLNHDVVRRREGVYAE